ncbi:MAG TPA: hypothetical protein VIF57_24670, partial [Polyangia bacterium]
MPAPPTNAAVRDARVALAAADDAYAAGLDRFTRAKATLDEEHRTRPDSIHETAAELEFGEANRSLNEDLRPDLLQKRHDLSARIAEWVPDDLSIDDEIFRLGADTPIVFLPVRVETRFERTVTPALLKVRVFPDEIFINTLEKRLRREEVDAAKRYYNEFGQGDPNDYTGLQQWRELVTRMSPERAVWVLRVMQPTLDAQGNIVSFPDPPLESEEWTRPSQAVVPDRWIVVTYRGSVVRRYHSSPVIEPLITGVDPTHGTADQVDVPGSNGLLKMDSGILWTLDYDAALANGMAVTIQLDSDEATQGFDRIIVFGVKSSMTPADAGAHLQDLFDVQHNTKGLGLVRQGTPTNNTENAPTPLPRDPQDPRTYLEELAGVQLTDHATVLTTSRQGDIKSLATLLGFADGVFPSVLPSPLPGGDSVSAHLDSDEGRDAQAMNRALFPVLYGVYLDNFIRGLNVPTIDYNGARSYFVNNVRARGPVSAFRVGKVPYGVLPAVSWSLWTVRGETSEEAFESKLIDVMRRLAEYWRRASENVFRVKPGLTDAYADVLHALGLHSSAREMRIREVYGPVSQFNLAQAAGADYATIANNTRKLTSPALTRIGLEQAWKNSILMALAAHSQSSELVTDFVVPATQLSEETFLPSANNYIDRLKNAPQTGQQISVVAIKNNTATFGGLEQTMLYKVLRHSVLAELVRIAAGIVGPQVYPRQSDLENPGIRGDVTFTATPDQLLKRTDFAQSGGKPLGDFARAQPAFNDPAQGVRVMEGALAQLAQASTAELDRLFTETVDLGSHRLDAWLTALATRRAFEMRASQSGAFPHASHLGGYAFLENVRPGPIPTGPIETQPFGGGFIQTPSLTHANAAAILRSGYIANKTEDPQKYAVDLSSDRVRGAREILDAIRAGAQLGEILGQIFERRLHDNAPDLNRFRYALRLRYPLVTGKLTPLAPGDAVDRVGARNVVDGLRLWTAFRNNQIPWGQADLNPSAADRARIETEIKVVEDLVDRVADLAVAESVYQMTRGNVSSAVGHMDALSRGRTPAQPEMSMSPRTGPGVAHRVALVFPEGSGSEAPNWPTDLTPRATVERTLDRWVSRVLGDPKDVACAVTLADPSGATSTKVVKLFDLGFDASGSGDVEKLRPLDVVALAREATVANQGSTLDHWIAGAALRGETNRTVSEISYARQAGASRTFPEVMEIARALSEVLAGARSLAPADLSTPSDAPTRKAEVEAAALTSANDVMGLAGDAVTDLLAVRGQLQAAADVATFRAALEVAAAYVPTLFPAPGASQDELGLARDAALAEVDRRQIAANA